MSSLDTHAAPIRKYFYHWIILSIILAVLLAVFTLVYATGALTMPALYFERWLLNRPITRLDCIFFEWRRLGSAPLGLLWMILFGGLCWRLGFHRRIVILLVLVFVGCMGIEVVGKWTFDFPLPPELRSGMTVLTCPQMHGQPLSVELTAMVGWWPLIPDPPPVQVSWARDVAQMPFVFVPGHTENGYPAGHAMRGCLLGFMLAWLSWTRLRPRAIGRALACLLFILSFFGGFVQLFIGVHTITDTIGGYLLGAAGACLGIALLILHQPQSLSKR